MNIDRMQADIFEWANVTFPGREFKTTLAKLVLEEIPEFCVTPNDDELADLVILVFDLASMKGINVQDAVMRKMAINRKRTWEPDQTGLFYRHTDNGHTSET